MCYNIRMAVIQRYDNVIYPVDGISCGREECTLGISKKRLLALNEKGFSHKFGQLRNLVMPGLVVSTALFQGLQRRLMQRDNTEADADKLIYIRKPSHDYEWEYADRFYPDRIRKLPAPERAVFFVIATPNTVPKYRERYPEIFAWIERWGWIEEDGANPGMPEDFSNRYKKCLWKA